MGVPYKKTKESDISIYYESIDTLPLWNWDRYLATKDINWFVIGFTGRESKVSESEMTALRVIEFDMTEQYFLAIDDNDFEINYETICKENNLNNAYVSEIKDTGNAKSQFGLMASEVTNVGARQIFGNLVSREYARYYPDITEELDHHVNEGNGYHRGVYKNITTTQENCEGVYITKEGMLMGELISNLYNLDDISKHLYSHKAIRYEELTHADKFLFKRKLGWGRYNLLIGFSYGALLVILWFVLKGLYSLFLDLQNVYGYISAHFGAILKLFHK